MSTLSERFAAVRSRTLQGGGTTSQTVRQAAADHASRPPELGLLGVGSTSVRVDPAIPEAARAYVDKVAHAAPRVTDADVAAMREAGLSDDAIFELTAATALGAGLVRYELGMALLRGEE